MSNQANTTLPPISSASPYGSFGRGLVSWRARTVAAFVALGIVLGLAILAVGPVLVLAAIAGLAVAALAFSHPEIVILMLLSLAAGVIPPQLNLFVDLQVGRLQLSDLLLLWLLFVVIFRLVTDPSFKFRKTPLDLPLLLFFTGVLLGLGVAVLRSGARFSDATYDLRMLMTYLAFFAVTNLVRTEHQMTRLANGVIALGMVLAIIMLVGVFGGPTVAGEDWVRSEGDVARAFHPGYSLVYMALFALLAQTGRRGVLRLGQLLILGAGLLVTLDRNLLVVGAVSLVLMLAALRAPERSRLRRDLVILALAAVLVLAILAALGAAPAVFHAGEAFLARIERMFSSEIVSQNENVYPRLLEIRYAAERLAEHPVLGIGLRVPYRPAFHRGERESLRFHIHFAYLGIWLKTGLFGLVSFLWLSVAFVRHSLGRWRSIPNAGLRAVVLGFAVAFIGMMISNLVEASFIQPVSLAVYGVALGLSESILSLGQGGAGEHR